MISAKVILESVNDYGDRLTTFELVFPRFILPQFNTHRAFSRNAASSRAIPTTRLIQEVIDNPVIPVKFGKNQAGMQAGDEVEDREEAIRIWLAARDSAVERAQELHEADVHKEVVNRILEPFAWARVVMTTSDEGLFNFFHLRSHEDAQPEIIELAEEMNHALNQSNCQVLKYGEWHIPYLTDEDKQLPIEQQLCLSAARCASVSYGRVRDGQLMTLEDANRIWSQLIESKPAHASPVEHQAMAAYGYTRSRNFNGFIQHREILGV